ncbi:MAG: hypothetical protein K1X88_04960 [Nannocystaceae bacterium]|nr:hypothetical protein [Nannocystaceae bacterium]
MSRARRGSANDATTRRTLRRAALICGLLAALAANRRSAAAAAPPAASASAQDVEIHVVGAPDDRAWLLAHLRGMVEQLGVAVRYDERDELSALAVLDPPPQPAAARARVWIDLQSHAHAKLYVVDAAWERVLVRRLALGDGLDEVAAAEIGTIVESSVRALLEGGAIGVAREQLIAELAPAPAPPPPPTAPIAAPPRWAPQPSIAVGYAATGWAHGLAQHGPLLQLELAARRGRVAWGGRIEGRVTIPVRALGEALTLRMGGGGARAAATFAWQPRARVALESSAGGGAEIVGVHAQARSASAQAFAAQRNTLGVLALALGPALTLGRGRDQLLVRLLVGVDVVPQRLRYVTADTGALQLAPWIVRPGGAIAIGWRRAPARGARPGPGAATAPSVAGLARAHAPS